MFLLHVQCVVCVWKIVFCKKEMLDELDRIKIIAQSLFALAERLFFMNSFLESRQ